MGFTPHYETSILILHIHFVLLCQTKAQARKASKTSQIKQKYQLRGSLVSRPFDFMVLYYCIPKARTKVSQNM